MAVIKGGFEIVKRAMLKELMKRGDDGIMLTLPKNEILDLNTRITMDRLIRNGIDPDSLTSPDQVLNVLENINNQIIKNATVLSGDDAAKFLNKAFPKKGDVVDMTGKKIDTSQGIMGGKSVKELMESGQVQKGTDDIKISEKITDREMFKNSNLNKTDTVADTITYIKTLEPIDAMKEANLVIGRKDKYKNLTPEQSKKILQDTEDHIIERDVTPDDFDPEYAKGGRIGFSGGKGVMAIIKNLLKVKPSGDDLKDFLSKRQFMKDIVGNTENNRKARQFEMLKEAMEKARKEGGYNFPEVTKEEIEKKIAPILLKDRKLNATGGRAGFYTGGLVDVEPSLSDIGHGSDALMARTRLMSPGSQATTSTGLNYLLAEDNDNIRVPFKDGLKVYPKIMASKSNIGLGDGKNVDLQDLTYGGTVMYDKGPFSGGIEYLKGKEKFDFKDKDLTLDKDTTDRELANLILMMKLKNGSIKFKGNKDDQMINFSKSFADGGRIGFSGGGMGRRAFLKLLAALTGSAAAAKTGLLSLGGKEVGKKAVTETVKQAAGSGTPPPYFFKLVEKIKFMGDDTLASQDKTIAKKYKDYVMEEDFAGNITIVKKGEDLGGNKLEDVYMSYKVDDVALKNKKGYAKVDEYEEFTARPDAEGKMKDVEQGVPDEVVEEAGDIDAMTLKRADGGRIGFSGGKIATNAGRKFLEKVFGKESFKNMIENDPRMEQGMLEVVEMFRKKDKKGLKMYLQKYLPHMDDAEIEDFIIGSDGSEGITGQLIRLGSGREYESLIDLKKQADQINLLDDFNIDGVSKNAEGGRIGFSGGGIFRAIIAKAATAKGMKPYEFIKATSYKSLPREVKMFMSKADFEKLKMGQEEMYSNYIDMMKTRKNFQDQIEGGKNTPAKPLFENMEKMMDEQSYVPKTVTANDIAEAELMVKNRFNKGRKDNAEGGLQTMLGE